MVGVSNCFLEGESKTKFKEGSKLYNHQKAYKENVKNIAIDLKNHKLLHKIADRMNKHPIKCFKYNNSLDADVQDYPFYESTIHLSDDGR